MRVLDWCQVTSGVVWCSVVWCGVVWCGVVWCGAVRCGAVRCGAVRCGAGRGGAGRGGAGRGGAVPCGAVRCGAVRGVGETWRSPIGRLLSAQELPLHSLSLRLLVQAQLLQHPRHRYAWAQAGLQQRGTRLGVGVPNPDGLLDDVAYELSSDRVGLRALHVGPLHGGGAQCCRPLYQNSRLPQLVAHRHGPTPHLLVQPRSESPASRPPLVGLGRAGPKVGGRFWLCPTEEACGVQHRVAVGGPVCQDNHRGDVVHAVRSYMALLVTVKPVEGEAPRRVVRPPLRLISDPHRNRGSILQLVAQRRGGKPALVPVGPRGEKGEGAAEEPCEVHLWWLLRRRIHANVEVRDLVRRRGDHIYGRGRGEAAAPQARGI